MASILMVYASQTGNTEMVTKVIQEKLEDQGHDVDLKSFNFDDILVDDMEQYDATLIGTYTWGDGDLPFEVEDFYMDLEEIDITEILIGVYGTGDAFFETFGNAIKEIWEQANEFGAVMMGDPLIVDLTPDEEDEYPIETFTKNIDEMVEGYVTM